MTDDEYRDRLRKDITTKLLDHFAREEAAKLAPEQKNDLAHLVNAAFILLGNKEAIKVVRDVAKQRFGDENV